MTNNDILRRVRDTFDFKNNTMIEIFAMADFSATEEQVAGWLEKDAAETFIKLTDTELAVFLNGLINFKRGKRDGEQPKPEAHLNNNMVFQKLRIALNLKAEEILGMLQTVGVSLSKHELSAFFRKPENKHYRECKDDILRQFLSAVQRQSGANASGTESGA
ncbi:DUF1456 family protein [Photobacterium sp. TLY01]|uniref:DUF1456 family protein n=1 Tax=Photobacterium sp. TLY01 TaxID=2907534 RepID=UPI001F2CB5EB|nr:DUF1456 family protein [Photobacterium sp. TLY01]UIP28763.1 DUF1456 family protein [Photobacterium sp. TLY01]